MQDVLPPNAELRPITPIHVLFVEDHPEVIQSMGKILSLSPGITVDSSPTPDEAIIRFKQIGSPEPAFPTPQVVVLDWNVHGENTGMKIFTALRNRETELGIQIPTIIMTSEPERVEAQFGPQLKLINAGTYNTDVGFDTPIVGKDQYEKVERLILQAQRVYAKARSKSST